MRRNDWRKIGKLFLGWGEQCGDEECFKEMSDIAEIVSMGRLKYLREKVARHKKDVELRTVTFERIIEKGPEYLSRELRRIKFEVLRENWQHMPVCFVFERHFCEPPA